MTRTGPHQKATNVAVTAPVAALGPRTFEKALRSRILSAISHYVFSVLISDQMSSQVQRWHGCKVGKMQLVQYRSCFQHV